ncbi:hypothetical protein GGC64_003831 [Mycobacterium sp. OAS707]|uniref:EspA/EspE family type VII secretion system effector n=1 Tax=Mycobacterium sp. OAS707 TaxID=2663822 RepID=UPI00178A4140|nr:EspA/EspE family type VII secretion system effector [Mycobacterium sp. OAS707]MBE1549791.1 hypothetical protein [Mycobacterium sp. OAS707]
MGIFDVVENVYDFVTDAAGKVKNAAQVVEFVAKRAKLSDIADVAKSVGKAASPLHIAPTPVLVGGQKVIAGMLSTAGEGDPEAGEGFGNGSRAFDDPKKSLADAHPDSSWEGGPAPAAYERRVGEQENRVATLADADGQIASIVSREAGELVETRRVLNGLHNWLADYGEYTQTLGVIPEVGRAIQMQAEMLAVGMALKDASAKMWEMHNNANANAAAVHAAIAMYQQVSTAATQQDSVGDFDPAR